MVWVFRHNPEIQQMLEKYSKKEISFEFTPHLTPMFRGILLLSI